MLLTKIIIHHINDVIKPSRSHTSLFSFKKYFIRIFKLYICLVFINTRNMTNILIADLCTLIANTLQKCIRRMCLSHLKNLFLSFLLQINTIGYYWSRLYVEYWRNFLYTSNNKWLTHQTQMMAYWKRLFPPVKIHPILCKVSWRMLIWSCNLEYVI